MRRVTWDMMPRILKERSIPEPNSGCWLWLSYGDTQDYGRIIVSQKSYSAHRVSWVVHRGSIPDGLHVLHKCDTVQCVNPDHLFLGTNLDNIKDRTAKGRGSAPLGTRQHLSKLSNENVIFIYKSKIKVRKLAEMFSVSRPTIYSIKRGRMWSWLTGEPHEKRRSSDCHRS